MDCRKEGGGRPLMGLWIIETEGRRFFFAVMLSNLRTFEMGQHGPQAHQIKEYGSRNVR